MTNVLKYLKVTIEILLSPVWLAIFLINMLLSGRRNKYNKPRLIFGPIPLLNNKYWSNALREIGFSTITLMNGYYGIINSKSDFDLYYQDFDFFKFFPLDIFIRPYRAFSYLLRNADIVHLPFDGGFLYKTPLRWIEPLMYKIAGIKTVFITYGADSFLYSRVVDASLRHVLLCNYPLPGRYEKKIRHQVEFFMERADFVISGLIIDGIQRWDILPVSALTIDTELWNFASKNDPVRNGINGVVRILHTPNHRAFKGTEFLIESVKTLREEGLLVELDMLERVPNSEVRDRMRQADILAEQFIISGYALSGIEGMAAGLPVLSNLTNENFATLFKRYSYLKECPIVSTNPENLKDNLRLLIKNPALRYELGQKGQQYVEKYHSKITAQLMFSRIYEKIWNGKEIDLLNYFHPLTGQYYKDYKERIESEHD